MSSGLEDLDIGPVVVAVRTLVDEFVAGRGSAPAVGGAASIELLERLARHPGDGPGELSEVIELLLAALEPGFDSAGAGFLSYIPTGALPAESLCEIAGITIATDGPLSIVTFAADAGEAATRQVLDHLNSSGDVHVSSTMLGEQFVIRAAFLSQLTSAAIAQRFTELVAEAVAQL